ncbi:diguanylate cyclase [Inhella sp.]|uniref:GGDEF domain-containing protein n=1 Tax=Inhella sp. TaxID=1921806 RepID=UPI0035B44F6B
MSAWLLLLTLVSGQFLLAMGALSLRRTLGLAPLMLVMGALEGLKTYVLTGTQVELAGIGTVRLGSVVSYMNALTVVQVLYLRSGLGAARQLAWTLVCVAVALALLNPLIAALMRLPEARLPLPIDPSQLIASGRIEAVGNLLLLGGLLAGVVLVNAFQRAQLGRWLSLLFTLLVVASVDTLLFLLLAFGPEALQDGQWLTAIAGKASVALWLATLAYAYLRLGQTGADSRASRRPRGAELLAALSFRGRLADMEQQLQTDPLTGAFNRRYLEQTAPELLHLDQLRGLPTALVLLDLDHFKHINDENGHLVGDQALRHTAEVVRARLRRNDVVLRYGGEEFLLLLPCTGAREAERTAQQVLQSLQHEALTLPNGQTLRLDATLGVAVSPEDGHTLAALLERADARLYEGKRAGRGRVVSPP